MRSPRPAMIRRAPARRSQRKRERRVDAIHRAQLVVRVGRLAAAAVHAASPRKSATRDRRSRPAAPSAPRSQVVARAPPSAPPGSRPGSGPSRPTGGAAVRPAARRARAGSRRSRGARLRHMAAGFGSANRWPGKARAGRRAGAVIRQREQRDVEPAGEPRRREQRPGVEPRRAHAESVQRQDGRARRAALVHPVLDEDGVVRLAAVARIRAIGAREPARDDGPAVAAPLLAPWSARAPAAPRRETRRTGAACRAGPRSGTAPPRRAGAAGPPRPA